MSSLVELAFAHGEPQFAADFRSQLEDFVVDEVLGFEPSGEGEHLYLQIEKRDENTHWISENIARQAGVKAMDVAYCGKKDRFAVTTQWFSVYLPKGELKPDELRKLGSLNPDGTQAWTKLHNYGRHKKKLRKGEHQGNAFQIRLRRIPPQASEDIEQRLALIRDQGVPNYFGEQRFGREGNNLKLFNEHFVASAEGAQQQAQQQAQQKKQKKAQKLRRNQKYMVLSAARAHLFNLVLSARVGDGSWREVKTGPLWGRGELPCSELQANYEQATLAEFAQWCETLEHVGLFQERRELILLPQSLTWQWLSSDTLELKFTLPAGEFATALLRELVSLNINKPHGL